MLIFFSLKHLIPTCGFEWSKTDRIKKSGKKKITNRENNKDKRVLDRKVARITES